VFYNSKSIYFLIVLYTFRSFDGSCNNLKEPKFGMRGTPFQRILENDYADGKLCRFVKKTPFRGSSVAKLVARLLEFS
jgi:hypothetical protein